MEGDRYFHSHWRAPRTNSNRNRHPNGDCDSNSHGDPDPNPDANLYTDAWTNIHTLVHADTITHLDTYSFPDSMANRHPYHTNQYPYTLAYCYANHTYGHANTAANGNPMRKEPPLQPGGAVDFH